MNSTKHTLGTLLFVIILISSKQSIAQTFDTTAWKYATSITAEELSEHLHIVASDEMEGRETGKRGQKLAMQYLIDQFKNYGIKDYLNLKYKQSFPLIEQKNTGIDLKINDQKFQLNRAYSFSPSVIQKSNFSGEIIFVGYGVEEEALNSYAGLNVEGKAVFFWEGNPKNGLKEEWSAKRKVKLAKEKGAAVIFYYDKEVEKTLIKYEHYFSKPKTKLIDDLENVTPVIRLTKKPTEIFLKEGKLKLKKLEKNGIKANPSFATSFTLNIDKPTTELTGENVIAYIEGTDKKEELVVLTAHYDHIGMEDSLVFNGADDDGTGTVALLEIAQAFSKAVKEGHRPRRSILIMPVSGEEKGLLGSKYYTNHPIFPLKSTVSNLNIDMIGRYDKNHEKDSNYIYLIGSDKLSSELHDLSEKVNEIYLQIGLDYTFNDKNDPNRFYYRSDHYNFAKNNIPVIFYFSGVHKDYHKATDTVEKIDFEKTEKVSRLVFLTAWEIANREERLKIDQIEEKNQ